MCGIFGIWNPSKEQVDVSNLTYFGLHSLQHRGQEGAGIVVSDNGMLKGWREIGLLSAVFKNPQILESLQGNAAIGHVRYSTSGDTDIQNIQPFLYKFHDGDIAIAHNGNLTNAKSLRIELENNGAIFHSNSDTEVLVHLIRMSKKTSFIDKMKDALNQVKGGFAYLVLTKEAMYVALDPNGFRPLSIGRMKNGSIVVASETCALDGVGAKWEMDVRPGELITINNYGLEIDNFTTDTHLSICSMEFIYFARPDSNIYGVNVHNTRKNSGKLLARQRKIDADIVIGIPNSSLSAASGYAEESGLPYELGLVKNQYVQRTFIEPTQELRELGVKKKLSPVRFVVKGKRIVLVDDSIVRSTTITRIVKMLREAGALEVHVVIASPPLKYPCFYGIDIQTQRELIAAYKNEEEIRKTIDADSLEYLTKENLIKSINDASKHSSLLKTDEYYTSKRILSETTSSYNNRNQENGGLCVAYFDGKYETPLFDYEEDYIKALNK